MAKAKDLKSGGGNNKKSRRQSPSTEGSEITLPTRPLPQFSKSFIASLTKRATEADGGKVSSESVRDALMQQMASAEYDPIMSLIDKIQHGLPIKIDVDGASEIQRIPLDPKDIIRIELQLLEYLVPKLKSVESKQELDLNINVSVTKFGDGAAVESIDMTEKAKKAIDIDYKEE